MTATEFWARVDRRGPDECWEWKLSRNEKGYGIVWFRPDRSERAHRIAWELSCGEPIPKGRVLMHSCDNTACCNTRHMKIGTNFDNMVDMANKGRRRAGLPGERNLMARLSSTQAMDIRANWLLCRTTKAELARRFGVSRSAVRSVIMNRSHLCF